MAQFQGQVALVTGSGAGIGAACAHAFAKAGAAVVVTDINAEGGEVTAEKIRADGGQAEFFAADVTDAAAVAALRKQLFGKHLCKHSFFGRCLKPYRQP